MHPNTIGEYKANVNGPLFIGTETFDNTARLFSDGAEHERAVRGMN